VTLLTAVDNLRANTFSDDRDGLWDWTSCREVWREQGARGDGNG